ncbi:MAG TPA: DUF2959 family protein [Tepidisphaeraceae bacterium]|jgi:hypothetical protein|nr:DUF2959 family protein [Tepidisphaeraceae bacterium]
MAVHHSDASGHVMGSARGIGPPGEGRVVAQLCVLITAMRTSESKTQPVPDAFHGQVLFLKHRLNPAAIASLKTTAAGINQDVSKLIDEMNASINEADTCIARMNQTK